MNSLAIGIFQNNELKSLNSNFLFDASAWKRKVSSALRRFLKHKGSPFYDDNGMLVSVDEFKSLHIVIVTAEDVQAFNRLLFARVCKVLREADDHLTFEMLANVDAVLSMNFQHKEIFENQNRLSGSAPESRDDRQGSLRQLRELLDPQRPNRAELEFVFKNLKFDFLKEEAAPAAHNALDDVGHRVMDEGHFNEFLVNIDGWNPQDQVPEPIKVSMTPVDRLRGTLAHPGKPSLAPPSEARPKASMLVEEVMGVKVHETDILGVEIKGRLTVSHVAKFDLFQVSVGNPQWHDSAVVAKSESAKHECLEYVDRARGFGIRTGPTHAR